jgi:hypothetical protein
MTDTEIEVGERYLPDELPENDMNSSGKVEWVGDDLFALAVDGKTYEFKMVLECTGIVDTSGGEVTVLEGER